MGFVEIDPDCQESLRQSSLSATANFLRLPGIVLCGHRNRHVLKVDLAASQSGTAEIQAFLKKEHRVPWRDRLTNALAGFGLVSKSTREARTLRKLAQAGIACPKVLAYGEDGRQAFLLLDEQSRMIDIRHYLAQHAEARFRVARALGRELARMHAAGFTHGDLYAKHILVGPGPRFCLLDWQRGRRRARLSRRARQRDLAMLDATLLDSSATDRLRLVFLRHYLRDLKGASVTAFAMRIRRLSLRLQKKPRICALRRVPLPSGTQSLIWLDGEALCVTPAFRETLSSQVLEWLRIAHDTYRARDPRDALRSSRGLARQLVRRRVFGLWSWLASWWRRAPAPEVRMAALLFRLERHGVPTPKLLAFGQKNVRMWTYSFLLTEGPASAGTLLDHLRTPQPSKSHADRLRQAGTLVRRVHDAGYSLGDQPADFEAIGICPNTDATSLALTRVDGLKRCRQPWPVLAKRDLLKLRRLRPLRRTDLMRFYLGYVGNERLTAPGRALLRELVASANSLQGR